MRNKLMFAMALVVLGLAGCNREESAEINPELTTAAPVVVQADSNTAVPASIVPVTSDATKPMITVTPVPAVNAVQVTPVNPAITADVQKPQLTIPAINNQAVVTPSELVQSNPVVPQIVVPAEQHVDQVNK